MVFNVPSNLSHSKMIWNDDILSVKFCSEVSDNTTAWGVHWYGFFMHLKSEKWFITYEGHKAYLLHDFTWRTVSFQSNGKWRQNPALFQVRTSLGSLFQRLTHKMESIKPKISGLNKSTKLTLSESILRDDNHDSMASSTVQLHFPCLCNEIGTSADLLLCRRIQWLKLSSG